MLAGGVAGAGAGHLTDLLHPEPRASSAAPLQLPTATTDGTDTRAESNGSSDTVGLIADGITDNSGLLNKILEGSAPGSEIRLPAGVLVIAARLRLPSNITLSGAEGRSTTIRLADGADAPFVLAKDLDGVTIRNLTLDGGVQNTSPVSLQIDSCSKVLVEECNFVRMSHAVHVYGSEHADSESIIIRRNSFSQIDDFAVRVSEGSNSVTIRENIVTDVKKVSAPSPAAFYIVGRGVSVIGNTVLSSEDTGVLIAGEGAQDISVSENVMSTMLVSVFAGSGARRVRISGNRLISERDFGIHLFDREARALAAVVIGNQIISSGKSGIQVEGVSEITITANAITDPGTRYGMKTTWRGGIVVEKTEGGTANSLTISGNVIASSGESSQMSTGILVADASENVHVQGNSISGSRGADVSVDKSIRAPYYVETKTKIFSSRSASER
ncbi:right-handed parallel beta-helix repeat-containing protein [Rathayibacter sp. PhB152]|uniref:right-handed parallel beta-helix repeat-containing protein n=1 Tax=Rathayibacter sp. PhB152 TaxID=2485190 RepID=UPI001619BFDC|nr:right-handed parallel beta-helix repeat-containing protein [Rathayibacter sp. PhB152]